MVKTQRQQPGRGVIDLPEGVSLAQWSLEKVRWQNPRIRCLLGCIHLIEEVTESNFSILHCSPKRLREIWSSLMTVARNLRVELKPLLEEGSMIGALEAAVNDTEARIKALEKTVLAELDAAGGDPTEEMLDSLRPTACIAIGKLQSFLLDSLGQILAADPRSSEDTDYYLSRGFARDIDDAEWLHTSVWRLEQHLVRVNRFRESSLTAVADHIASEAAVPSSSVWETTELFLDELVKSLAPKLQRIIGLRGIRIDELEIVETSSTELPRQCSVILEISELAATVRARMSGGSESTSADEGMLRQVEACFAECLVRLMRELDGHLRDLITFVPLWRSNLAHRRALAFRREDSPAPSQVDQHRDQ